MSSLELSSNSGSTLYGAVGSTYGTTLNVVLDDGTECDMDLGTYERMLDQNLTKRNFVTSGRIYAEILDRERPEGIILSMGGQTGNRSAAAFAADLFPARDLASPSPHRFR